MMKRTIALCVMCALIALILPAISEAAQWTYPLAANLLENKNGNLVLANRENLLDEDFVPNNLVFLSLRGVDGPHELRREAADALYELFRTAEQDGFLLYIKSSYRSYQTQNTMYRNRLEKYGRDDGVVAYPGSSDHQTGLGVDVLNRDWAKRDGMTPAFGNTDEAKWIEAHCADFGFILRYLPEKQDVTGIIYEPWHLRYIGRDAAEYIMENRLSLEEFAAEYQGAIARYEAAGGDFQALCQKLNALPEAVTLKTADESGDPEVSLFYETP